ncbi:iron-sulfur cluster assembly scaffold protein [Candidatus Pelagibacter bacterium]|jgi:nitrogen fixation NifU-like protein|nr:iron-sulfur cluster assembly scaffold protein [Candidatus Pelagibacter bacterium]MDA9145271.1 iron-sulfur cluster assembly scaffold protein [Candidatus Pelagibacter sp.]MDA8778197.1 iron-sulfur cluster assembly scaffold protein [Candidatus Pelagibacter bacterium]MDA9152983.1 iron-sulfur cluster assembly scaffold protein [Candidatus Pelagibacter sp.]MDB2591105.1 iron-sulfur cluster assembly scaffold protein [Candidatus Pelagibacter bacterium]|tara:strand:- start:581 stop:979 length:399 start_codon:yes stop_codon:yes gene_type:complete
MDLRILEIASHTENNKVLENFTHKSKHKNPLCGDEMEISLIVKDNVVKDMGYQCKSCVYCQASVSLLSRKIKDKKIEEIKSFILSGEKLFTDVKTVLEKHWKDFKEILDKKNIARKDCLLLPLRAVLKALKT